MIDNSEYSVFISKVKIDESTGCWEWAKSKVSEYGRFYYRGLTRKAHRVSYELHVGLIPKGIFVCHRCDNPRCVNPEHLFLGDQTQNMADMVVKGRQPRVRGSRNGNSKLTEDEVRSIRSAEGLTHQALADKFGVGQPLITMIRNRKIWSHI